MFTGLVREVGRLEHVARRRGVTLLRLSAPVTAPGLAIGDSLAVNGICLTVTRLAGPQVEVEATDETRRVTTLDTWRAGHRLHLEPSLRAGEQMGGHFVLGHVDGVGRVVALELHGASATLRVALAPALAERLLPKGSIAVDGVSLTLDEGPFAGAFAITLIPHTLATTRFRALSAGDQVNLELDVLAKAAGARAHSSEGAALEEPPGHKGAAAPLTLASLLARGWQRGAGGR